MRADGSARSAVRHGRGRRIRSLAAPIGALAVLLSGCGGGSDELTVSDVEAVMSLCGRLEEAPGELQVSDVEALSSGLLRFRIMNACPTAADEMEDFIGGRLAGSPRFEDDEVEEAAPTPPAPPPQPEPDIFSMRVTEEEVGYDWPLTHGSGILICLGGGDSATLTFLSDVDDVEYGVNGTAQRAGYPPIGLIQAPHRSSLMAADGIRRSLDPLFSLGLPLCD